LALHKFVIYLLINLLTGIYLLIYLPTYVQPWDPHGAISVAVLVVAVVSVTQLAAGVTDNHLNDITFDHADVRLGITAITGTIIS